MSLERSELVASRRCQIGRHAFLKQVVERGSSRSDESKDLRLGCRKPKPFQGVHVLQCYFEIRLPGWCTVRPKHLFKLQEQSRFPQEG